MRDFHAERMVSALSALRKARSFDAKKVSLTGGTGWYEVGQVMPIGEGPRKRQDNTLAKQFSKTDIVFACVREVSTSVAEGYLEIGREVEGEWTPVQHEYEELFYANPYYSYADLIQLMVGRMLLTGASFNLLDMFTKRIGVGAFTPLPTHIVIQNTRGPIVTSYTIRTGDQEYTVDPEEMCALKIIDPYTYQGYASPLATAMRELDIDSERKMITQEVLRNKDMPGQLLSPKEPMTKDQRKQLAESYHAASGGENRNRARTVVLPVGFENVSEATKTDVDFSKLAFLSETRICMAFQVPPILIGSAAGLEKSSYANYHSARKSFYREGVQNWWSSLASGLTRGLLSGTDLEFRFRTSHIAEMKEDLQEVADRCSTLYEKGVVTQNEARAMIELDPIEGGDEIKPAPMIMDGKRFEGKEKSSPKAPAAIGEFDEAKELEDTLKAEFERQRLAANAMVEKGMTPDMAVIGAGTGEAIATTLMSVTERGYKRSYRLIVGDKAIDADIDGAFNVASHKLKETINAQAIQISQSTLDYTGKQLSEMQTKIRSALTEAGLSGDNTLPEMIKALTEGNDRIFTNAKDFRARRIAVTESSRAVHDAQIMAGADSGVVAGYVPLVSKDACEQCQVYDADNKPTGTPRFPFTSMSDALSSIGSYGGSLPPFHPNCRCTVQEVFVDEQLPDYTSGEQLPTEGRRLPEAPLPRPGGRPDEAEPLDQFIDNVVEGAQ